MDVNPFENPSKIKRKSRNIDTNLTSVNAKKTSVSKLEPQYKNDKYEEFNRTKKEFYDDNFAKLENQIDDFQRNIHREKYIEKFRSNEGEVDDTKKNYTNEAPEKVFVEREKIIIQNGSKGCFGCNPLGFLFNLRCCGCTFLLLLFLSVFTYLSIYNLIVKDFTLSNIVPMIFGQIDKSKLPNPEMFSVDSRLNEEIERVLKSENEIETMTIYESELNTFISKKSFSYLDYKSVQFVDIVDNKIKLYINRVDRNDPWTILTLQSDKLGKLQIIEVQYGKFTLSGEIARNFLNNLPLNIGNINIEKFDEKFSEIIFGNNIYTIDKVIIGEDKIELSILRRK